MSSRAAVRAPAPVIGAGAPRLLLGCAQCEEGAREEGAREERAREVDAERAAAAGEDSEPEVA